MRDLPPIKLMLGENLTFNTIAHKDVSKAHVTLGSCLTPTGEEALLAYQNNWVLAIFYSLAVTTIDPATLEDIKLSATGSFLTKIGYDCNFPCAVMYTPVAMGGFALFSLSTKQGVAQILSLLKHVYKDTMQGKMLVVALEFLQLEGGIGTLLPTDPMPSLQYITPCWLTLLIA